MSDDIVRELRHGGDPCRIEPKCVRCRGADEIERLRAAMVADDLRRALDGEA